MASVWENACLLISAKKDVDTILYIKNNLPQLSKVGVRDYVEDKRRGFYINLYTLIDRTYGTKKGELKKTNPVIKSVLDFRNEVYAHDDEKHPLDIFNSLQEMIDQMKSQLNAVKLICQNNLPEIVTVDYIPYDRLLFRLIHKVDPVLEEKIESLRHPYMTEHGEPMDLVPKSFDDVRGIRGIPPEERSKYGVLMEDGINELEGLQNRQDACIRINVLFDKNYWCTIGRDYLELMSELREVGFIDDFGIPHLDNLSMSDLLKVSHIFKVFEGKHNE